MSKTLQDIDSSISSTFDRALRSLKVEVDERNTKQMTRQSKGAILICGSGYIMADIKNLVYNYYWYRRDETNTTIIFLYDILDLIADIKILP